MDGWLFADLEGKGWGALSIFYLILERTRAGVEINQETANFDSRQESRDQATEISRKRVLDSPIELHPRKKEKIIKNSR